MPLVLKSPDFISGGTIPRQFTCDGTDISPALEWNHPPAATQSFALIADDPDAPVGTWVHWVFGARCANLRVSRTRTLPLNLKTSTYHALMRSYNIKDCLDQVHRFPESQCRA